MRYMPRMKLLFIAILTVWAVGTTAREASAQSCFPECREGFVCSPEDKCVSACNPVCDSGQRCFDGECYAKVGEPPEGAAKLANERGVQEAITSERTIIMEGGVVYQFLDTEEDPVLTAAGLQLSASFFPSELPIFLRPRVVVVLGEENYYEPSLDVGYVKRFVGSRMNANIQVALAFGFWPNVVPVDSEYADPEPIGPYFGLSLGPTLEFGKLSLTLHLERGYQLASDPNMRVSTLGFVLGYAP